MRLGFKAPSTEIELSEARLDFKVLTTVVETSEAWLQSSYHLGWIY